MDTEHHYAVVIGINRYPGLSDLTGPRKDAETFHAWLVDEQGGRVPERNVHRVLVDPAEEQSFPDSWTARPKSVDVESKLGQINEAFTAAMNADRAIWEQSRLYVYASGHGVAPSGGAGALLCANASPKANFWDMIEFSAVHAWYRSAGLFKEVLLLADCCREQRPLAPSLGLQLGQPLKSYGNSDLLVAFATTYAKAAFEDPDRSRGYFTAALIDGLRGGAADPGTGEIRADKLSMYIADHVHEMTHGQAYEQTPDFPINNPRDPMVVRPGLGELPQLSRKMTLRFPAGYAGRVRLQRDRADVRTWDPAQGPWTLDLPEADYTIGPVNGGKAFANGGAFRVIARNSELALQVAA